MICADTHCPRCNPETLVKMLQCEAKTLLGWPLRIRQAFLAESAKKDIAQLAKAHIETSNRSFGQRIRYQKDLAMKIKIDGIAL